MEQRFDDLNMQAMALADNELTNIANTLILSDAENAHITALVLKKTGISANTAKPIVHKRRFGRFGIILAAAVLTIAAMGVTVSGYLRYNQPLVEHHFGVLGSTCPDSPPPGRPLPPVKSMSPRPAGQGPAAGPCAGCDTGKSPRPGTGSPPPGTAKKHTTVPPGGRGTGTKRPRPRPRIQGASAAAGYDA